jgi:hypothetical protein
VYVIALQRQPPRIATSVIVPCLNSNELFSSEVELDNSSDLVSPKSSS